MTSTDKVIAKDGRRFYGADRVGFTEDGMFVFSAWTTPPGDQRGSFFTTIPISDREYRAKRQTKTAVFLGAGFIDIFDDWGTPTRICAETAMLDTLFAECVAQGLPILGGSLRVEEVRE